MFFAVPAVVTAQFNTNGGGDGSPDVQLPIRARAPLGRVDPENNCASRVRHVIVAPDLVVSGAK